MYCWAYSQLSVSRVGTMYQLAYRICYLWEKHLLLSVSFNIPIAEVGSTHHMLVKAITKDVKTLSLEPYL